MNMSERIVNVTRADIHESIHYGHIAVVNAKGELIYALGNPDALTFIRSTAKPLQAIPIIESGAAEQAQLTEREIAVICASHSGQPDHVETVQSILAKIQLDASHLRCGVHRPWHRQTRIELDKSQKSPSTLHNNCSGKHAGMLVLAKYLGAPIDSYLSPDHPVQQHMLQVISDMASVEKNDIRIGVDGCGVPVFGIPVQQLALAYARMGQPNELPSIRSQACQCIIEAIAKHPFYLAGSDRFDTKLIETTNGRIIGKMGAEGIFAVTIPSAGIGIAIKVEDGAERAMYPAVVEILKQMQLCSNQELEHLQPFHQPAITNRRGEVVGMIQPDFTLRKI